jgi:hypothetical protein
MLTFDNKSTLAPPGTWEFSARKAGNTGVPRPPLMHFQTA